MPARKSLPSTPPAPAAAAPAELKPSPKAAPKTAAKASPQKSPKAAPKAAPMAASKAAPKPVGKPATKAAPPAKPPKAAKEPKAAKPPKVRQKPVRDSFTMPEADFSLVATLKARALAAKRETKKSELLRAGLHALAAMDSAALLAALQALEPIKTGRPKKGH
jgi:hypothetical protein